MTEFIFVLTMLYISRSTKSCGNQFALPAFDYHESMTIEATSVDNSSSEMKSLAVRQIIPKNKWIHEKSKRSRWSFRDISSDTFTQKS